MSADAAQLAAQTSLNIFRSFMKQYPDGSIDARGVISNECYKTWLRSRKTLPSCPEKAFQRALSGHLTGVDGRVPFNADEEIAILKVLRKKARWECFRHCDVKFGESGFRAKGFHEKTISGEILKSRPKKRAKRAIEEMRKMIRLNSGQGSMTSRSSHEEDDEDTVDEDDSAPSSVHEELEEDETEVGSVSSTLVNNYPSLDDSAAPALKMQIPNFIAPLSGAALSILTMLVNTTLQGAASGSSWMQCLNTLSRTIMLSRGWFGSPNVEKCERLMASLNAKYPGDYIMLLDYTSMQASERILLQNDEAVKIFGGISSKHGGFKGMRTPPEELWKILRVLAEVSTMPAGKEVSCRTTMYAKTKPVLVDGCLWVDDEHKVIVERGRLVEENEIMPSRPVLAMAPTQNLPLPSAVPLGQGVHLISAAAAQQAPLRFMNLPGQQLNVHNNHARLIGVAGATGSAASAMHQMRMGFWH